MQTLARAALRSETAGTPLPTVYAAFARAGVYPRRGEVTLIAAAPATGKSALALDFAAKCGVPTLYFSCDSDAWTMAARLASMKTGATLQQAEANLENDEDWAKQVLSSAAHMRWCFDAAPTLEDIVLELDAYAEVMGTAPELVVIDNLVDLTHDDGSGEDHRIWKALLKELKWLARDTGTAFVVLHHVNEQPERKGRDGESNRSRCPSRTDVSGKVNQHPALVLTLAVNKTGELDICPVKNRHGKGYPQGDWATTLRFFPETMTIEDLYA